MTHDGVDDDQDLRKQLRALDPAASLRPADPTGVARLVEDIVSDHLETDLPETRETGVHERSPFTWLVAAAAVLLIAGVGAFFLIDRGTDDVPVTDPGEGAGEAPTVTTLSAPAGVGVGRCAVPSAEILARQPLAFDGVVGGITDGVVTLTPTMFYAGEPTDLVRVAAPPEVLQELILSVKFEVGQRYLVSAAAGQVSVCGYSGPWSPDLEQLYVEAFAR